MNCCTRNNTRSANNDNCRCIQEICELIARLQCNATCDDDSCTRKILGLNSTFGANTRPVTFYSCCDATPFSFPFGPEQTLSEFLRIEKVNGCCVTCRVLEEDTENPGEFFATGSFVTLDLKCVGAIKCQPDVCVLGA